MAHLGWHQSPELFKLSEEWSFCVGDGSRQGFPLVIASPGFERLTLYPRKHFIGKKCGDVLRAQGCNPKWVVNKVRDAVGSVASAQVEWADFLVVNRRFDATTYTNYVRIAMLNTLTGCQEAATAAMMLALQVDVTDIMQQRFQDEARYDACVLEVRRQFAWPVELESRNTKRRLTALAKAAKEEVDGPAAPLHELDVGEVDTEPSAEDGDLLPPLPVDARSCRSAPPHMWQRVRSDAGSTHRSRSPGLSVPDSHPSRPDTASVFAECTCQFCRPQKRIQHFPPELGGAHASDRPCRVYLIEYRHTQGNFQPTLLGVDALRPCVEPRHVPNGPLIFVQDARHHAVVLKHCQGLHPRHVLVEEPLLPAVVEAAGNVKANKGRKVNEKTRTLLHL